MGCPPAGGGKALLTRRPWLDSFISRVKPPALLFHLLEDVEEEVMVPKKSRGHLEELHSSTALTIVLEGAHLGQDSVKSYLV